MPVYNAQFAVIAVVYFAGKHRKVYRHERSDVYAGRRHLLIEPRRYAPAAHIVIDYSHDDSLASLFFQYVGYLLP